MLRQNPRTPRKRKEKGSHKLNTKECNSLNCSLLAGETKPCSHQPNLKYEHNRMNS